MLAASAPPLKIGSDTRASAIVTVLLANSGSTIGNPAPLKSNAGGSRNQFVELEAVRLG